MAIERIKGEATLGSCDILHWLMLMTSDVIGQLAFGESFELLESGKKIEYINTFQSVGIGSFLKYELPWLYAVSHYIPLKSLRRMLNAGNSIHEYGGRAVENLKRHRDNKPNLFATALAECDSGDKAELTENYIQIEASNLIFAGADTTASTLTYLVWAVLKRPELQARLEAEVAVVNDVDLFNDAFLEKLPLVAAEAEDESNQARPDLLWTDDALDNRQRSHPSGYQSLESLAQARQERDRPPGPGLGGVSPCLLDHNHLSSAERQREVAHPYTGLEQ
ncbi:cytochrome P450 [Colletotrichum abscissum]|uniref:Cytochrome P450 n=1 Tax=Colletotrichum abscissum TaxID=1671311 RepID=A0A9P9X047_9PEZI|nr:cytochrome P450 [Colletotrichum abscissum]KAI3527869.1 cytochrome P450 [Colletotrichum abscissum]KAK1519314.1 cytochrome P450 [Colletotrichum abscissum]